MLIPYVALGTADHDYPFLATDMNLASRGYVEEEFFYSGTANRYNAQSPNATGPAPTASIVNSGNPYKTRMMVRRPIDPAKFNGVVIVEWTNVTSLMDTPQVWFRNHEQMLRAGYAYVGIAAQNLHIAAVPNGLRNWSPIRYGTLDIADDDLSYDVFAQGIQAVRSVPAVLGGLQIRRVIATGVSQSATRLAIYVNAIFPRDPAIVDGVQPIIGGQKIRDDLTIPVMKVLSEVEFPGGQTTNRQPDTDRFRTWFGNALGGIRLATFAVPTATSTGANTGGGNCSLYGVHIPFDTATLSSLYPTHDGYVQAITQAANQNVLDGFVLPEDAQELIRDAQASTFGTGLVCGPLCVDFKQFMSNPSTSNLRDISEAYYFPGASLLNAKLDKASLFLAQGYTAAAQSDLATRDARFTTALQLLEGYIQDVSKLPSQGRASQLIADMLVDWAGILGDDIAAEIGGP